MRSRKQHKRTAIIATVLLFLSLLMTSLSSLDGVAYAKEDTCTMALCVAINPSCNGAFVFCAHISCEDGSEAFCYDWWI